MSFGAETPFILLARIQVKPDKVQEYLLLAAKTDKAAFEKKDLSFFLISFLEKLYLPLGLFLTWCNSNFYSFDSLFMGGTICPFYYL